MATVTRRPRASELVYGVEERLATRDAEVGMQGEDEGDGSLWRSGALGARSPRAWHVLAWCWACLGWPMPWLGEFGQGMGFVLVLQGGL
jgi:hypothetical protein